MVLDRWRLCRSPISHCSSIYFWLIICGWFYEGAGSICAGSHDLDISIIFWYWLFWVLWDLLARIVFHFGDVGFVVAGEIFVGFN